ncbi:hypothetical protein PPERSA_07755 [Pseudocohnilembus persalinus]|uniref:Uncharacterized protein n=1 Tax=Pseudocohnilembus persalinus TaxID=266149 RepID=A0A0V0R9U1_PSEPJ|nr:hypothetical protein PPERSA_07755 [Pseudocohnilembus persalinus]|eukprot:KRX11230.1 hypothetical protein PPERSA_07755 [Pseudocohnilembus persalinus]
MEFAYQQLKCPKKNHNNSPFTYICMGESCDKPERLLCTKCAIDHGHSNCYVLIEEVLKKSQYNIQNWPQDVSGQKVKNLISWNDKEQASQQIESLFEELQTELLAKLQNLKKYMVNCFAYQGENMREETDFAGQYFDRAYDLRDLKQRIIEFLQEDIDKEDMEDFIIKFLRNPERKVALDQAKRASLKLIPNCKYYIDPVLFRDIAEKEFYQKVEILKQSFTGGYQPVVWKLENSGLYQSNQIKEITPGICYQSQCQHGEEVLFSEAEFNTGNHGFRMRFDQVSENYRCHVLVGLYDLNQRKDEFRPYICLMCCDHRDSMMPRKNRYFDVHSGSQIDVRANFDTNELEIREIFGDGAEGAVFQSNLKNVVKSINNRVQVRKKFFVFFSSSGAHKISLISSY